MYRKILKIIELKIDKRGFRGPLRKTFIYQIYKFFKGLPLILDPRIYNLYSRDQFLNKLKKDPVNPDIYAHWFNSFNKSSEKGWENLYDNYPVPWIYIKATHFIEWHFEINPNLRVLEFGGGKSTFWFSSRAKEVITIENNKLWADEISALIKKKKN